jgi:hypothetical protein
MWHHASSEFFNTLMSNRNKDNHLTLTSSFLHHDDKLMSEDPELDHLSLLVFRVFYRPFRVPRFLVFEISLFKCFDGNCIV